MAGRLTLGENGVAAAVFRAGAGGAGAGFGSVGRPPSAAGVGDSVVLEVPSLGAGAGGSGAGGAGPSEVGAGGTVCAVTMSLEGAAGTGIGTGGAAAGWGGAGASTTGGEGVVAGTSVVGALAGAGAAEVSAFFSAAFFASARAMGFETATSVPVAAGLVGEVGAAVTVAAGAAAAPPAPATGAAARKSMQHTNKRVGVAHLVGQCARARVC
ncbi:MAG: hypothetical protein EOO65_03985, partial [Methanosarcinales archaeon]